MTVLKKFKIENEMSEKLKIQKEIAKDLVQYLDLPENLSKNFAAEVVFDQLKLNIVFEERKRFNSENTDLFPVSGKLSITTSDNSKFNFDEGEFSKIFLEYTVDIKKILNETFKPSRIGLLLEEMLLNPTPMGDATTTSSEKASIQVAKDIVIGALDDFVIEKLNNNRDFVLTTKQKNLNHKKIRIEDDI